VRSIDKSKRTVSLYGDTERETDLRIVGANDFIHETGYQERVERFLGEICIDYLDNNKSFELEVFSLIESVVNELAGTVFKFRKIERKDPSNFEIYVVMESKEPILFPKVSQGTLSVVAMFGLIYQFLCSVFPDSDNVLQETGIIFIDEIDAHLHPDWQQKIIRLLRRHFPRVQFFLAAHSPLVVAGCLDGEVSVLRKTDSGRFTIEQFDKDLVGWETADLYKRLFEVEDQDENYLLGRTLYPHRDAIGADVEKLESKEDLTKEEEEMLEDLYDQLFYIRKYNQMKDRREEKRNLEAENENLRLRIRRLESD
jgi:hypothetical protein